MLGFLVSFLFAIALLHGAEAQSDASCLPFYNWTFNTQKKSACEVASSLLAVCTTSGSFPVNALPDDTHYLGPTIQSANPCQCNSVTYSLMSACAACQGKKYLSWSVWTTNCPTVYTNVFPKAIPSGVSVPGWAYLDVKTHDNFDQNNAKLNANLTESTAVPTSTSLTSTFKVTPTVTGDSPPPNNPSASSSSAASFTSSSSASNVCVGYIGGVVGGAFGAVSLVGILHWY